VRLRAALAALAGALAVAAGVPAVAQAAGSYAVSACSPSSSAGAWQQVNTNSASMTSGNECGGPLIGPVGSGDSSSLFGEDLVGSSTLVPSGSEAGWQLTAPAGTVITGVSYYRAIDTAVGAADWQAGLFAANGTALDICQTDPSPCSEPNNQVPVVLSGLNTSGLFFGIYCDSTSPSECDPGATLHYAQAQLYSISVTLSETGLPSLSSLGGSLWGGGALWGTGTVTFSASDPSGISQVALDGPTGQAGLQPQVCDYAETQPCPDLPSGSMSVNTTLLHDGPQTLTLLVTNAAGNTTSAVSPSVVIDNNGPPAPAQLTASAIAGNTAAVQLTWSDPANPPEPVASAEAEVCQASCGPAVPLNSSGSAQVAVTGPRYLWRAVVAARQRRPWRPCERRDCVGDGAGSHATAVTRPRAQPPPERSRSNADGEGAEGRRGAGDVHAPRVPRYTACGAHHAPRPPDARQRVAASCAQRGRGDGVEDLGQCGCVACARRNAHVPPLRHIARGAQTLCWRGNGEGGRSRTMTHSSPPRSWSCRRCSRARSSFRRAVVRARSSIPAICSSVNAAS